ncbi:MAG: mannose-1-phosphate guanylyltransferase/mannose-6-phosphate isomerase [Gammaproteobacteria bacterium]
MPMIVPVILSGGSGTRLWPLSRQLYPKQLLPLLGQETMLQQTLLRLKGVKDLAPPVIVCNEEHRFLVAEQLRRIDVAPAAILLEPAGRNTAPAVALAAARTLAAEKGQAAPVAEFVEKPDGATAESYVESGDYYWNSGMFMFRASRYVDELRKYRPEIVTACVQSLGQAKEDLEFVRVDAESFEACPADSIDYAVMENTDSAWVVPLDAGWSDVGSWTSLHDASDHDAEGNVLVGDAVVEDTRNCYVYASDRLVAAVGLEDCVVVETKDAVLVAPRSRGQDVKRLVDRMKAEGRNETALHREVFRPWGSYDSIDYGDRFQVKRITVKPGAQLSLQMHHHRAEHWIVVQGTAKVTRGEETFLMGENQSTYIPMGTVHRLENPGKVPLHLIEVQSGTYLGEDDIVRYEDTYGRS